MNPRRTATAVAMMLALAPVLGACGTSDYCKAVEGQKATLSGFGANKTNKGYLDLASGLDALAKKAPNASIQKDYATLAKVTRAVVAVHREVKIPLESLNKNRELVKNLSSAQIGALNNAYNAFNDTADERAAIVGNIKQECDITLTRE